jgi:hypothetical protein
MRVEFRKTGERRYAVIIRRENLPELKMEPAPGFDPLMPHDLLHFLVEQELGLRQGIFGQIALGGTAGTFHAVASEKSASRAEPRFRRDSARRGKKLLKQNLDDCAQSERATYICLHDWFSHSEDAKLRARAEDMKKNADSVFEQMTGAERAKLNKTKRAEIRARMDELSRRWSALRVNESITLEWYL